MIRKLAKIVQIDAIVPIVGADAIEGAKVGGWTVVVKKGEYAPGNLAVYFEIDSFLPEGNASWQFLVDKSSRLFNDVKGHVLRSIKLRGQVSQGLLLGFDVLRAAGVKTEILAIGEDVSQALGITKYERPLPDELIGVARGYMPSRIPTTDQERIQNLAPELSQWATDDELTWEATEKIEGQSCTFALIDNDFHVCTRAVDLLNTPGNSFWGVAEDIDIENRLFSCFNGRNLAIQGELVGPGIEDNIYSLTVKKFYLYDIYDIDAGRYLNPQERAVMAKQLGVEQVPVIDLEFVLSKDVTMDALLTMADGQSILKNGQLREGLVFKSNQKALSFKVVSNKYLLKQSN